MSRLIEYWSTIPSSHRTMIMVGGLLLFWLLEGMIPLSRGSYRKWGHAGVNLFFTLTTVIVNFIFAFAIVKTSQWAGAHHFGLLYLVTLPNWLFALLGLLILDLISAWFIHWLEHRTKWMWKFHIIHHVDRHIDATTANRHHPGESILRAAFTLIAVAISGSPFWVVMLYQSLSVVFAQFEHANIRLPQTVDRALSWVVISPDMHKVHHHFRQPHTDSNYGNIFAIWDRLFGTFTTLPRTDITYGLDTHMSEGEADRIGNLLQIPFQPYRPRE
jgi:sterol desaturase/sphingolipid hydroxylase (fatty acid hydroxylase superfamily)